MEGQIYNQTYNSYDEAFSSLVDEKGNDYCGNRGSGFYFKTGPDTFGDGPYKVVKTKDGWEIR